MLSVFTPVAATHGHGQRRRQDLSLKGAKYGYSPLGGANKAIFFKISYQN
jgi:hypothetical protein